MRRTSLSIAFLTLFACDHGDSSGSPPDAPEMLEVQSVTGGAHLTWADGSDDEDEFVVERKGATGDFAEIGRVPFDSTSYHDATATTGTWVYRVGATNHDGESWSDEASVEIP
jgi:hypothetical protein